MKTLLSQISKYLNGTITKEHYYGIAEKYFSDYGSIISNTKFRDTFLQIIPDACLFYLDEPGMSEVEKEQKFHKELTTVYSKLVQLIED